MLGAHELLLIVRAQNQASAALGRFSRDLRALEARRAIAARQGALQTRAISQAQRIYQMQSRFGSQNIAMQNRALAIQDQIAAVQERGNNLELRRAGIVARGNQLIAQEERLKARINSLDSEDLALVTKRMRIEQQMNATANAMASRALRGGRQRQVVAGQVFDARTGLMQARLARDVGAQRLRGAQAAEEVDPARIDLLNKKLAILDRRVTAAGRKYAIAKGDFRGLKVEVADLNRTLAIQSNSLKEVEAASTQLAGKELELRGQIARLSDAWAMLSARERAVQGQEAAHERQLGDLARRLQVVNAEQVEMAAQAGILERQLQATNVEIAETNMLLKQQGDQRWASIARGITHASRLMQLFGLVSTAAMGYAAHSAANFDTEITRAATQARKPGERVQATMRISSKLMDQVLKQMQQFPASSSEMADSLYEIFSGTNVQNISQATKLLRVFNMMAVAGQTDLKTMTDAGISLYNNFGNEFPTMTKAANAFFAAVRFGRMDASQFAGSLANILPIAKEAGLSFRDVADAMALLTRQSGARFTSRDATGLARLIQVMTRPEMIAGLHKMGVEVEDAHKKMRPLIDILSDLRKQMDLRGIKPGPETLNLFKTISAAGGAQGSRGFQGTIQAQRSFAFLINNMKQYHTVAGQVNHDNDEFMQSFRALQQTPGVQWKVFVNQMKALVIVLGQGAIPVLIAVGQWVANLVNWLNSLSPHTRHTIGEFLTIVSVGTLVVGILGSIAGGVMSMVFAWRIWQAAKTASALEQTAASTGMLAGELGAVNPVVAAVLGGMALLGLAYMKYPQQTKAVIAYTGHLVGELFTLDQQLLRLVQHPWEIIISPKFKLPKQLQDFLDNRLMRKGFRAAAKDFPGIGPLIQVMDLFKQLGDANKKPFQNIQTQPLSDLAMTLKASRNVGKQVAEAHAQAAISGVKATKTFVQLYRALLAARKEVEKHPNSYKAQYRYQVALSNLQANVTKQQYAAAKAAVGATTKLQKKYSDQTIIQEAKRVAQLSKLARSQKTFAAWKAYYRALDKLQANASSAQLSTVEKMFNLTDSAANKAAAKADKTAKRIRQTYQQVLSNLQSMYQTYYQQNQNAFGQLFQGPFMQSNMMQDRLGAGEKLMPTDLTKDLRRQLGVFRSWRKEVNDLQRRGLPQGLMNQILQLGPAEAQKQVAALRQMTPAQLKEYAKLWKAGQKAIHDATMRDLNNQLKSWRKQGQRIALAIAAGLRDENVSLEKEMRNMILRAFPALAKKNEHTRARSTPGRVRSTGTSGPKHETHTHYHTHVTTQAHPNDVKRQLKDANWHHRNR